MTLQKISAGNSINCIPSTNSSLSENSHDHKLKTVSNLRKHNKKNHKTKIYIKDVITGEGFRLLK